jgi:hypothetical protein
VLKKMFLAAEASKSLIPVLVTGIQPRRVCVVKRLFPSKDLDDWIPVTSTGMKECWASDHD